MTGKTIAQYKILEKLGEGGMGVVYKAEDTKLNRLVALKFLSSGKMGSEKDKARFLHEAQAAAALAHPNICTVYEINEAEESDTGGKQTYIAMAYIEGGTLQETISEKKLTIKEVLQYAIQIAGGISEAHEKKIIHRDIKSANIMVNQKGQAIIMDFGLAKQRGQSMLTVEGTTLGTISYMSPEQTRGDTVDFRTDIWAFGVLLYEMIGGQMPFRGDYDQAVIYSIMNEEPQPLATLRDDIPPAFQAIIDKALAKDPEKRYQNMAQIVEDLEAIRNAIISSESGITAAREITSEQEKVTFFKDIMQRRVPQIVGIYLAVSWGIIQFIEWLVNRYPISPHLPEFSLAILASMIPTVLLVAYFHGKPGRDRWTMTEKVGIPLNVVAATIFLFFSFSGKDLGAATKTVRVEDEAGNTIHRAIPKSEFRQRLAIFYFDNQSGDSTLDWLQYGLPYLIEYDLTQDSYISTRVDFSDAYAEAGFKYGTGVPLSLKKQIAEEHHLSKFISGILRKENDQYIIETTLYNTSTGRRIAQNSYTGPDIFMLADDISSGLKKDMKIPDYHIERTEDLPISELTTNNLDAFKVFTEGYFAYSDLNDFKTGISKMEQAVEMDSLFALAWLNLHGIYAMENRTEDSRRALNKTLEYKYRLSEPQAYLTKIEHYALNGDLESAFGVTKNWVQLYPDNVEGRGLLAMFYRIRNQLDLAIEERKRILEIDPTNYDQIQMIADLYQTIGDIPQALKYLELYAEKFPDRYESFVKIGDLYKTSGDFSKSSEFYKKALLLEPDKYSITNSLADIEVQLGNFDQALIQYEKALAAATSDEEKAEVYNSLSSFYEIRGQIDQALKYFDLRIAAYSSYMPEMILSQIKSQAFRLYLSIGKNQEALQIIETFKKEVTLPITSGLVALLYTDYYLGSEDPPNLSLAEQSLKDLNTYIESVSMGQIKPVAYLLEGKISHAKGEYQRAVECYAKTLQDKGPVDAVGIHYNWAMACRESGQYDEALEQLNKALTLEPINPKLHHELALLYDAMDEQEKAQQHLNKALAVWDEADPAYKPAQKARQTLANWNTQGS